MDTNQAQDQIARIAADCDMWQRVACALAFKMHNAKLSADVTPQGFVVDVSGPEVANAYEAFPGSHAVALVHACAGGGFRLEIREFSVAQKIIQAEIARRSQLHDMPPSVN